MEFLKDHSLLMYPRSRISEVLDDTSDDKSDSEDDSGEDEDASDADFEQSVDIEDAEDFQ